MSRVTKPRGGATLASLCFAEPRSLTLHRFMRRISFLLAVGATCAASLTACARFRHSSGSPSYSVRPAASRAPRTADIASQYGCTSQQVAANWQTARLAIARAGAPICSVLGRYGDPISVSKSTIADMHLVSMLHREPGGRYINATFVYYDDTKVNRQLKRPIGRWVVDRITTTR